MTKKGNKISVVNKSKLRLACRRAGITSKKCSELMRKLKKSGK